MLSCQQGGAAAVWENVSAAPRPGEAAGEAVCRQMQEGQAVPARAPAPPHGAPRLAGGPTQTEQKRLRGPEKFGKRHPPSPFLSECLCLFFLNV